MSQAPAPEPAPITEFSGEHRFLSNFVAGDTPIGYVLGGESLVGDTVEHVYQACKTWDPEQQRLILAAETPGRAKKLGSALLPEQMQEDWSVLRVAIMDMLIDRKFAAGSSMAQKLLDTGGAMIIEGNTWCDTYWGKCSCPDHLDEKGAPTGENWLGRILMTKRALLLARQHNLLGQLVVSDKRADALWEALLHGRTEV